MTKNEPRRAMVLETRKTVIIFLGQSSKDITASTGTRVRSLFFGLRSLFFGLRAKTTGATRPLRILTHTNGTTATKTSILRSSPPVDLRESNALRKTRKMHNA